MAGTPKKTPAKAGTPKKSPMKSAKKSPVKSAKKSPVKSPKKGTPKKGTPKKSPKIQKAIKKSPKEEKKTRKVKKVKDENAPKRAQSAYFCWLNANRANIIKEHNLDQGKVTEVMKKAGELWAKMTEEQKKPYNDAAAKDKARYEKEKEEYVPDTAALAAKAAAKGKKDPNAPKKATTAYFCFMNANRAKIIKEHSLDSSKVAEVAKKLGEVWNGLTEAQKKPYVDEAAKDKVRADQETAAYNQKLAAA